MESNKESPYPTGGVRDDDSPEMSLQHLFDPEQITTPNVDIPQRSISEDGASETSLSSEQLREMEEKARNATNPPQDVSSGEDEPPTTEEEEQVPPLKSVSGEDEPSNEQEEQALDPTDPVQVMSNHKGTQQDEEDTADATMSVSSEHMREMEEQVRTATDPVQEAVPPPHEEAEILTTEEQTPYAAVPKREIFKEEEILTLEEHTAYGMNMSKEEEILHEEVIADTTTSVGSEQIRDMEEKARIATNPVQEPPPLESVSCEDTSPYDHGEQALNAIVPEQQEVWTSSLLDGIADPNTIMSLTSEQTKAMEEKARNATNPVLQDISREEIQQREEEDIIVLPPQRPATPKQQVLTTTATIAPRCFSDSSHPALLTTQTPWVDDIPTQVEEALREKHGLDSMKMNRTLEEGPEVQVYQEERKSKKKKIGWFMGLLILLGFIVGATVVVVFCWPEHDQGKEPPPPPPPSDSQSPAIISTLNSPSLTDLDHIEESVFLQQNTSTPFNCTPILTAFPHLFHPLSYSPVDPSLSFFAKSAEEIEIFWILTLKLRTPQLPTATTSSTKKRAVVVVLDLGLTEREERVLRAMRRLYVLERIWRFREVCIGEEGRRERSLVGMKGVRG